MNDDLSSLIHLTDALNVSSGDRKTIIAAAAPLAIACAERVAGERVGAAMTDALSDWKEAGYSSFPDFGGVREALRCPSDEAPFFFWGPMRVANAGGRRGWHFECFLATRHEPCGDLFEAMRRRYPHPQNVGQSMHLVQGSDGLTVGNNLVFFPENIRASSATRHQPYSMFFFNKFPSIFSEITIPLWDRVGSPGQITHAREMSRATAYEARCAWGYMHDYFHHQGPRPFDKHIASKTKWDIGLVEELKVDLQTLLACRDGHVPHGNIASEFIVFERSMRYPSETDWDRSFDSGTGLFLLSFLHDHGAVSLRDGRLEFDIERLYRAADVFVGKALALEALDTDAYASGVQEFVRAYLPSPSTPDARFSLPPFLEGSLFERALGAGPIIRFDEARLALP